MEQFIFFDEAAQAGAPLPLMALNTVGPTIMQFGTHEQKAYFLPKILSGEIDSAIGYSEPDARTDLAAFKTRAVRDGDMYVINGRRFGRPTATPPTGSGLPSAPTPTPRRRRASPCCSSPRATPATPAP